jgi:excisionase family DNA binding protein
MAGLMTVSEVADYLRTTTTTIYRWLKEGKLTAVKIGKEWRIAKDTLHSVMNKQRNAADSSTFWSRLCQNEHLMVITNKYSEVAGFEVSFFKQALKEGARMMKGCWWQEEDEVIEQYEKLGLDAAYLKKEGFLNFVNFKKMFKKEGIEGPIKAWRLNIEKTIAGGIPRLWASGSPNISCCGNDGDGLLAFESGLNEAIKSMPVIGVCPYALEDDPCRENFGKILALMGHHSGVAFYHDGQYALLRN